MKVQNPQTAAFTFEGWNIRGTHIHGEPWFVAKDVCDALGIKNSRDTLVKTLAEDEKGVATIYRFWGEAGGFSAKSGLCGG